MPKIILKFVLVILLSALLATGCAVQNEVFADQSASLKIPTFEIIATPTTTSTMTGFPTATLNPSATLYPVLPLDQTKQLVLELLQTNGGCELPCWWGIDPRTSSFQEASSFLSTLKNVDVEQFVELNFIIDPPGILVHIVVEQANDKVATIRIFTEQRNDPYIPPDDKDMLLYLEAMENYRLENILMQYGQPAEVWVRSFSRSPVWFDTHTLLYYPEIGIAIDFSSDTGGTTVDDINYAYTCPNIGFIALHLVDPASGLSLADVVDGLHPLQKYMRLEDATDKSIEEFYQVFQNPDCETYLLTPEDLWPSEYDNR